MRMLVAVLYCVGGALPVLGVLMARHSIRRQASRLDDRSQRRRELAEEFSERPGEELQSALARQGLPRWTFDDFDSMPEFLEAAILRHALSDLRGPALITLAGVVSGTVASVWSLYL